MTLGAWTIWTPRGMVGNIFPNISSYDLIVDILIRSVSKLNAGKPHPNNATHKNLNKICLLFEKIFLF